MCRGHVLVADTASTSCGKGHEEVRTSQKQNPQEKGRAKNPN